MGDVAGEIEMQFAVAIAKVRDQENNDCPLLSVTKWFWQQENITLVMLSNQEN